MTNQSQPIVRIETVTAGHPRNGYVTSMFKTFEAQISGHMNCITIPPSMRKCADIPYGRNLCLETDIKNEYDWDYWLWIDDDQNWKPKDICYLVESMEHVDQCHAIISRASEAAHFSPVVFDRYDENGGYWHTWMTGWEEPKLYGPHNGHPTLYAGTGFTMIRRDVFEKISRPWYYKESTKSNRNKQDGHDLVFCKRMHEAGLRIGVDSRCDVGHYMESWVKTRQHFVKSGFQKNLLHKEWAQRPLEVSKKEDINTEEYWDTVWSNPNMQTWYKNRKDVIDQVVPRIPLEAKVLHWGCGNGWLLTEIEGDAKRHDEPVSRELSGVDISKKALKLARLKVVKAKLLDTDNIDQVLRDQDRYDMIIITDWIEKMVDPKEEIGKLVANLADNGQLLIVFHDKCYGPDECEEHHHLLSEVNVGHLMDKLGGRTLEHAQFKEQFNDEKGNEMLLVPKFVLRAVFNETADLKGEVAGPAPQKEDEVCPVTIQ